MEISKRILVPIDGSTISKLAYDQAIKLAKKINGKVTLIHILEPITYDYQPIDYPYVIPPYKPYNIYRKENKRIMKSILNGLVGKGKKEGINVCAYPQ